MTRSIAGRNPAWPLAVALALAACGDDGAHTHDDDAHTPDAAAADALASDTAGMPDLAGGDGTAPTGRVAAVDLGDGVTAVSVDATEAEAWVYLDLAAALQVTPADPATSTDWHLAFQRFRILANGGTSGPGDVAVAFTDEGAFADFTHAPADGWRVDGGDEDHAFAAGDGWYVYDPTNHTLAARLDRTWFVRTAAGDHFKLRLVDYYDAAGSSGVVTLHVAPVAPPPPSVPDDAIVVTAPADGAVHVDLLTGADAPASSEGWDLAITGLLLGTNGGSSGPGVGGARLLENASWDEIDGVDTVGFDVDAPQPLPGPPGSGTADGNEALSAWYDYDPITHTVSAADKLFAVRRADGTYLKLRVLAYGPDDTWTLRAAPVDRAPAVHTLTFSAPSGGEPVYVSLRAGAVVDGAALGDAATSTAWDLAFSGVRVATNGGPSGPGAGAALAVDAADLDAITAIPADGWLEDAELPIPGPPGSGTYAGNPALADWYDYDPVAHVASPRAGVVFLVRAADGSAAKLVATGYAAGEWTIAWVYAGPRAEGF